MKPLDYGRSLLIGNGPSNEVRFWVESRTRIVDERTGRTEDYVQCGSCKSEDTFAPSDLFYEENYDFLPIFGPEFGLIFRRKAWLNPDYRSCVPSSELWGGQVYRLTEGAATELTTPEAILQATYNWQPLVAQTELRDEATGLRAIIEYPVKTMNTRRQGHLYQVDTGPVAFPDLARRPERLCDTLSLAFVAFNAPHFADFVIEAPTPLPGPAAAQVHHYSRRLSLPASNRLYALA